jgi:ABC-2 type transport system ATP-binding protein
MIKTHHLTKTFGDLTAVNKLDLDIAQGEFFAFLGPNGAGKTTTIKLLAGLIKPTAGSAVVAGHNIQTDPMEARRLISYVPDFPFLYDKLEPVEFMHFVGGLYGMSIDDIERGTDAMFTTFDLDGIRGKIIESLSHGTRQRLVIASALLHNPKVIIIDEPMVGLDPRSARTVKDVLKERSRNGVTIFLSTHTLDVAEELADRIGIMHHGRLIAAGSMEQLRQASGQLGALEDAFLTLTREEELEPSTSSSPP